MQLSKIGSALSIFRKKESDDLAVVSLRLMLAQPFARLAPVTRMLMALATQNVMSVPTVKSQWTLCRTTRLYASAQKASIM